jgi:predicted dinucleotide-binding enzyme
MKIGFIGGGSMAEALASRWVGRHEVLIGGRDQAKAQAVADRLGHGARAGTAAEAAAFGDAVVLATRYADVFAAIDSAGGAAAFAGKVVIDINNPVSAVDGDFVAKTYDGTSLAEAIARYAPGARVVKAFNMCQARVWRMDPPLFDGRRLVVMYCGDDSAAKQLVAGLIGEVGADAVDVGPLRYAGALEAATGIVIKLLFSGRDWGTVLNLIQPEVKPIG